MKRKFIFLAMLLLTLIGGVKWNVLNAQETVTIGNEEEAIRTYSVPFDLYNGYGVCQQLYTADEIGKTAGAIESLALKFVGPTGSDMQTPVNQDQVVVDFEIYVENTTMTTLSAFQVVETGDLYFSGKQPMESDAWTTFEFSNSFEYDGTNLLITIYCVGDKYEMKTDNNYYPFYIYSTNGVQCLSASPQDKPIAGASFNGLNENSGKNILQLTFAAGEGGEGGEEPEPTPEPEQPETQEPVVVTIDGTVGGYEANASNELPFNTNYHYTTSQQIYLAEELGIANGSTITNVAFNVKTKLQTQERNIKIYMVNTEISRYVPNSNNSVFPILVNESDLVYDGKITIDANEKWYDLELEKKFAYTGNNVLLCVYDYTGTDSNKNTTFNTYNAKVQDSEGNDIIRSVYKRASGSFDPTLESTPTTSFSKGGSLPQVQFTCLVAGGGEEPTPEPEPTPVAPATPTNVVATATETAITLTWEAVENATYYNIYTPNNYTGSNVYGLEATTYTFEGLTAGTEYCFEVAAVNDVDESEATEACATTEEAEEMPEGDWTCTVSFTLKDSYSDGWNGNTLVVTYGDVTETLTLSGGATATINLEIPKGSHVTATYAKTGLYQSENGFVISYYGGDEIVNVPTNTFADQSAQLAYEFDVNCMPSPASVPTITATAIADTKIVLAFEGTGASSYNLYKGGEVFATGVTAKTYTVEGLEPDTEYCFTATSVNVLGETAQSEAACATTLKAGVAIVQIGTGLTNTYQSPICDYYSSYSISQQIYTAEEIGYGAGKVTSVSFYQKEGDNHTRSIQVYLKNVNKDGFGDEIAEWETLESDLCVYQGDFTFGTTGWVTIPVQNDFVYEGGNLMVCVIDNTGSYPTGPNYYTPAVFDAFGADVMSGNKSIFGTGDATDPLNITTNSYPLKLGSDYLRPTAKFVLEPASADVKVEPETIAFGEAQLGEYWSENGAATIAVTVKPIVTTITSITCDNEFFVLPAEIDYTANPIEFTVAYDHNAAAGEYTGNLTVTYGDGATKVVPMTATAYAPAAPDVFELAQEITFTENAYTDTPVFANLKDDYNLPKEANAGNTPDAVYSFELAKESYVTINVIGTNAVYALYQEDFSGEEGPKADNKVKGNGALSSFAYDFNDGNLDDFYMVEKDVEEGSYKNHEQNWVTTNSGPDATTCLISYSYNSNPSINNADNYIVTKDKYVISADSKLTFDARNYAENDPDYLKIEVSADGENFTYLVTATPGMAKWATVEVELGSLLAEAGLEYGEYHIALHHQEHYHMHILVDNLVLSSSDESKISYPAGKYYLVAAAEDAFTVNVAIEALEQIGKFIGKVIDEKNNTPIAGATLKFTGKETYETTTKEDGTFDIDAVVGNYTLEISHPNYETKELTNLEITNSGTITDLMEIELVAIVKTATFVGGDSENPTAWNVAANWSTGDVPAAGADVIINANAVISSEVNVASLTINKGVYPYNSLTVANNGTLTVTGKITQENDRQVILVEGGQIFQKNEGITARFKMDIENPSNWETAKDGWQFISMPMTDVYYSDFTTLGEHDLYKYDGSEENEWLNYKEGNDFEEGTFKSGYGYLATLKDVTTATVYGTLNVANPFASRQFTYIVEDDKVKDLSRFHLVGNPFTYDIKWSDFNIIGNVYNIETDQVEEKQLFVNGFAVANGGGYKYHDPNIENSDATIKVGQGFFVKILENYATLGYQPNIRSSKEKSNSINVIASGKAGQDNVVINFAGQSEGFDKLQNFNKDIATVFVANNGKRYGIANIDENVAEVELSFVASQMGHYSISLDVNGEFETVTLVDRFTGIETNMLLEDEYNFTATSNDSHNRFVIRLANGQEPTANSQFVYQSGEELILSIEGSVQIVDMLGRVVYSNEHANGDNRINVAEFNDAAYVVRVVNEEGVKTQKVVIY